jgi:hypothetical protein
MNVGHEYDRSDVTSSGVSRGTANEMGELAKR